MAPWNSTVTGSTIKRDLGLSMENSGSVSMHVLLIYHCQKRLSPSHMLMGRIATSIGTVFYSSYLPSHHAY